MPSRRIPDKTGRPARIGRMTAPRRGVKVRMYRQGLGDCFLLAFRKTSGKPYYVLIDCGVIVGQLPRTPSISDVARHIAASTDNHLDLVIATHQHWDHLSGFVEARDIFKKIQMDQIWLAWTEDPEDELREQLLRQRKRKEATLRAASNYIHQATSSTDLGEVVGWCSALSNVLGFLGVGTISTTEEALKLLTSYCKRVPQYCRATDDPRALPGVKDVRIYVLGPPHDAAKINKYNDTKSDPQTYRLTELMLAQAGFLGAALDPQLGSNDVCTSPFDRRHQIRKEDPEFKLLDQKYFGDGLEWRRIDLDWLRSSSALALALDNATNNTSLALAIELTPGGKVLLFPADAQVGNWLSWHDQDWKRSNGSKVTARDLLAQTVLYKVGHHGSHNATLRQKGLELMTHDDLVALIPVDKATAKKKRWPMPWPKLYRDLKATTQGRILQADDKTPPLAQSCPSGVSKKIWKRFQTQVTCTDYFFEITIA